MTEIENPKWLTKAEAAEYLRIGESTLHRWVVQGRVAATKMGKFLRFLESDLVAMIERNKVNRAV